MAKPNYQYEKRAKELAKKKKKEEKLRRKQENAQRGVGDADETPEGGAEAPAEDATPQAPQG
ncbi:MAG TPA: hypothetical protein VN419_10450 [Humidesulfovibrio sp.]|uniref:hypothetical protein n=1 Tax=Humidesulfovibrio sp. TaxID=2910988 RepID=UPI002BC34A2E|nr:hypothetical protein [Humidesulfovibrio sp.]HWR04426.1 hypothetical protein [Humidesulfovibrio sp.]